MSEARKRLKQEIGKVVIGQEAVIDHLLIAMLCRGHALLLGVPGVGKTLMARSIARSLHLEYRRIQFTPDLMPSDIPVTYPSPEEESRIVKATTTNVQQRGQTGSRG